MTGFFKVPGAEPHRCHVPDAEHVPFGEEGWRCQCGKAYVRTMETEHNESWWQWERAPELDSREG